jgi:hypothetical protein
MNAAGANAAPGDGASLPEPLRACATHKSDRDRLKCYDEQMAALGVTRAAPLAATPPAATPPAAASPPHAAISTPKSADAEFGMSEAQRKKKREAEAPAEKKASGTMASQVKTVSKRLDGTLTVELDNGQVWQGTERVPELVLKAGDAVSIRPASMGSYLLSNGSGYALRVSRKQ